MSSNRLIANKCIKTWFPHRSPWFLCHSPWFPHHSPWFPHLSCGSHIIPRGSHIFPMLPTSFPSFPHCYFGMFWGFSAYYCVRKSKAGYFQPSTLIWLVGLSLVTLPHHARSPLWCSCLPGSRSYPVLDLARGRVWCLKSQWMQ